MAPGQGRLVRNGTDSIDAPLPACSHVRCSQWWQEVKSTGVPSVRLIVRRVTCPLPQPGQPRPLVVALGQRAERGAGDGRFGGCAAGGSGRRRAGAVGGGAKAIAVRAAAGNPERSRSRGAHRGAPIDAGEPVVSWPDLLRRRSITT